MEKLDGIMDSVLEMRQYLLSDPKLDEVLEKFKDFKEQNPRIFDLVLENKPGYFEELKNMMEYAKLVKSGVASLEDATKIVKNTYDNKYIYPALASNQNLTSQQLEESRKYVKDQQEEAESLKRKFDER